MKNTTKEPAMSVVKKSVKQTQSTDQKFEEAEPVRCPACFHVFVPFPKQP